MKYERLFNRIIDVKVLYGPRVHVGPVYDYNVEEGERIELTCSANGNPAPLQFEWYNVAGGKLIFVFFPVGRFCSLLIITTIRRPPLVV